MHAYFARELLQVVGVVKDLFVKMPISEYRVSPLLLRNQPNEFRFCQH
jgi:hypothetical protein